MISEAVRSVPSEATARLSAELAWRDFTPAYGSMEGRFPGDPIWHQLREMGTQLWLDTGDLDEAKSLWNREFTNLTTNNTLVNKEVQKGLFDAFVPDAARALRDAEPGLDAQTVVYELGFILNCRTALRLIQALDAWVSVELHPAFADDAASSVAYGRRYYAVCPERFIVKVPMTPAGFLAARQLAADGIPVNYTLGFSARENALAARFSRTAYVNVFMGRLNSFVADNGLGDGKYVGERATMATQMALRELREAAPGGSKLIGASMRSGEQLFDLAGLDVYTMPVAAAREFHRDMQVNPRPVTSQVGRDFPVTLAPGVDEREVGLHTLWEIDDRVRAGTDALVRGVQPGWTGDDFAAAARDAGLADLFPEWSADDLRAIEADGKIPKYDRWAARLRSGEVSLDALMSLSALYSFVTDQRHLDDRIRAVLGEKGLA